MERWQWAAGHRLSLGLCVPITVLANGIDPQVVVSKHARGPRPGGDVGEEGIAEDTQAVIDLSVALASESPSLSLLQRILLTTDGTVTHILEAYSGEAIEVVKLFQSHDEARPPEVSALGLAERERVLRRTILLRGRESGTTYLHADSVILPDRLQAGVRVGLIMTNKPIGRLLRENRTETFREIVAVWQEAAGGRADHFGVAATDAMMCRTYRVFSRQRVIMAITERFPLTAFRASAAALAH